MIINNDIAYATSYSIQDYSSMVDIAYKEITTDKGNNFILDTDTNTGFPVTENPTINNNPGVIIDNTVNNTANDPTLLKIDKIKTNFASNNGNGNVSPHDIHDLIHDNKFLNYEKTGDIINNLPTNTCEKGEHNCTTTEQRGNKKYCRSVLQN